MAVCQKAGIGGIKAQKRAVTASVNLRRGSSILALPCSNPTTGADQNLQISLGNLKVGKTIFWVLPPNFFLLRIVTHLQFQDLGDRDRRIADLRPA